MRGWLLCSERRLCDAKRPRSHFQNASLHEDQSRARPLVLLTCVHYALLLSAGGANLSYTKPAATACKTIIRKMLPRINRNVHRSACEVPNVWVKKKKFKRKMMVITAKKCVFKKKHTHTHMNDKMFEEKNGLKNLTTGQKWTPTNNIIWFENCHNLNGEKKAEYKLFLCFLF